MHRQQVPDFQTSVKLVTLADITGTLICFKSSLLTVGRGTTVMQQCYIVDLGRRVETWGG